MPFHQEAYYGELDKSSWGLVEVPDVARYGGPDLRELGPVIVGLEEYLGELRWYLDKVFLVEDMGGLEALPGCQRYRMIGNWKIACDNFAGDHYHTYYTHASALRLKMRGIQQREAAAPRRPSRAGRGTSRSPSIQPTAWAASTPAPSRTSDDLARAGSRWARGRGVG